MIEMYIKKSKKQKNLRKNTSFVGVLKITDENSRIRIRLLEVRIRIRT